MVDGQTIAVQPNYVAASTMTPRPPHLPLTITLNTAGSRAGSESYLSWRAESVGEWAI